MVQAMLFDSLSIASALIGAVFFAAGTIGLLRFPDVYTRLHAITKADTLGLGFIALSVAIQAPHLLAAVKILLVWVLAMPAGATACNLIADHAFGSGRKHWEQPER